MLVNYTSLLANGSEHWTVCLHPFSYEFNTRPLYSVYKTFLQSLQTYVRLTLLVPLKLH